MLYEIIKLKTLILDSDLVNHAATYLLEKIKT